MLSGVDAFDPDEPVPSEFGDSVAFEDERMPEQIRQVERELKEIRDLLTISQWSDLHTI